MREDLRATLAVAVGFALGLVTTSYLVMSDPDVRAMFRRKSERIRDAGWRGFALETARATVLELRDELPAIVRKAIAEAPS